MKRVVSVLLTIVINLSVFTGLSINAYASSTTIKDINGSYSNDCACSINVEYNTTLRLVFESNYDSDIEYRIQKYFSDYEIEGEIWERKSYSKDLKVQIGDCLDIYVTLSGEDIPDATYSLKVLDLKGLHNNSKKFKVGEPRYINYKYDENERCKWSTSNKTVATVSSDGMINPKNLGTCTINCKNREGKVTKYNILVNQKDIYVFTGSKKALPKIAGKTNKKWTNSKKSVASIVSKNVIGKNQGVAKLTCKHKEDKYFTNVYVINYKKLYNDTLKKIKKNELEPKTVKVTKTAKKYDCVMLYNEDENTYLEVTNKIYPTVYITYKAKNEYNSYKYFTKTGMYRYDTNKKKYVFVFNNTITKLFATPKQ